MFQGGLAIAQKDSGFQPRALHSARWMAKVIYEIRVVQKSVLICIIKELIGLESFRAFAGEPRLHSKKWGVL